MENRQLTPDSTFPYKLFRFAHKRNLDEVSISYFAVVSKDNQPVGLVMTINVDEQWHPARSAATNFWQIFVREFNRSASRSTLVRYEDSLKELNIAINKTKEKIHQPISVATAVFENNQIHFSSIGNNRILLFRDGKISDVSSGGDKSGNQFAAVTSGDLTPNDVVFLTNQNFYEFIVAEPDELWVSSDAEYLSKELLSRTQNTNSAFNCVIVQLEYAQPSQTTVYWEESDKIYPLAMPKFPKVSLPRLRVSAIKLPTRWPKIFLPTKFSIPSVPALTSYLRRPAIIAVIVFIILALVGINYFNKNRQSSTGEQPTPTATQLVAGLNRTEFIDQLQKIVTTSLDSLAPAEIAELTSMANTQGISLSQEPPIISELPESAAAIDWTSGSFFLVDQTGQLWQLTNNQLKQIDHQFKIINPTSLVAFNEDRIVITDTLGNIWQYDGKREGPVALSLPSPLSTGKKLVAKFGNNLYVYSNPQSAVFRQANYAGKITTSSSYFGLTPTIKNSKVIAWGINGDFLLVSDADKLVGVLRNQLTIKPIDLPNNSGQPIIAVSETTIALANENLLTIYDSKGNQVSQQLFLTKEKISALSIVNQQIWLVFGKKITQLTF